jgi:hypothetical protein
MSRPFVGELKAFVGRVAKQAKVRKPLVAFLAVILVLQLYFVRELIAAEVLFGLGFLVLAVVGGILYLVGSIGERSFNLLEAGVRAVVPYMHRGYVKVLEFSKKPFRHPRSESAQ